MLNIPKRNPEGAGVNGVKNVIAVGSGKGGVGKSSVAVNLTQALTLAGRKVGILDADIWGPSLAEMLGVTEPPDVSEEGVIRPLEREGIKIVTLGTLVKANQPVIWRGPMAHKAIEQFINLTLWGDLDYLIVDLPPGTGDVALSVSQTGRIDGAIVVTTPQEVAALDVRKAVNMFRALNINVLGVIENMSFFVCPNCGARHAIFGEGGGRRLAEDEHIPFLGEIPIDPRLQEMADRGMLYMFTVKDGPAAEAFHALARQLEAAMAARHEGPLPVSPSDSPTPTD
jgi:ATP-binding protein involved in chromosome partitioning